MNFFAKAYDKEPSRNDSEFGIVDLKDEPHAKTCVDLDQSQWDAIVKNENRFDLHFIPVDRNIKILVNGNERSLCDGLLHKIDKTYIAFVEIKNRRKSDIAHAKEQLVSTIELFSQNHDLKKFQKREAYIADRNHPAFAYSHRDEMSSFRQKYGFRLLCKNEIDVK